MRSTLVALLVCMALAGNIFAINISTVLNDGQGDFDPWNQTRWAAWYSGGDVVQPFHIDVSVTFAPYPGGGSWDPTLDGAAESDSLLRVVDGARGITIDGNGIEIDVRRSTYSLSTYMGSLGKWLFENSAKGGDDGVYFSQPYSASAPETVLRNMSLKGFDVGLRIRGSHSHPLTVENCDFMRCRWGSYINGTNATITGCRIKENIRGGMYNGDGSRGNKLIGNEWRHNVLYTGGDVSETYADIVMDTAYDYLIEYNVHQQPHADSNFNAALVMYRNMGETDKLRENCPHDNIVRYNTIHTASGKRYSIGYHIGARMGREDDNDLSYEGRDYANNNQFYGNDINGAVIGFKINTSGNYFEDNTMSGVSYPFVIHSVFYSVIENTINDQVGDTVTFWSLTSDYSSYSGWFPFPNDQNGGIDRDEKLFHVRSDYGAPTLGSVGTATLVFEDDLITGNDGVAADFGMDRYVDFEDFSVLAAQWLNTGCQGPEFCDGVDRLVPDGTVNAQDLEEFSYYWLETIPMQDVYAAGGTPIDIAIGDFWNTNPGDEFAVIWNEKTSNINGTDYYSIIIYDKDGIEVNRCGRSTTKWLKIAAGDFLPQYRGEEIAAVTDSAVGGLYEISIFQRGRRVASDKLCTSNTTKITHLAAGNFKTDGDANDEVAYVLSNEPTTLHFRKPTDHNWHVTTTNTINIQDMAGGNLDGHPTNGDQVACINGTSSLIYLYRIGTSSHYNTTATSGLPSWSSIAAGDFNRSNSRDEIAVASTDALSGIYEISYYVPIEASTAFKKATQDVLGVPAKALASGNFPVDQDLSSYEKVDGFTSSDYGVAMSNWGESVVFLPSTPQTTATPVFIMNVDPYDSDKSYLKVVPIVK